MIIIATAEPHGAYHLLPFQGMLDGQAVHLMPPGDPQGNPVIPISFDHGLIRQADLVVITGGGLTDWTEQVALAANDAGIPVVLTELAYPTGVPHGQPIPELLKVLATSPVTAELYASHLSIPVEQIAVTGHPQLDTLPRRADPYQDNRHRVLVLPTADMPEQHVRFRRVVTVMSEAGHKVRVRLHPRDPGVGWEDLDVSHGRTLLEDLAEATVVLAAPGTPCVPAAALKIPIIALEGTIHAQVPEEYLTLTCTSSSENILDALDDLTYPSQEQIDAVTGPVGGSAQRISDIWIALSQNAN